MVVKGQGESKTVVKEKKETNVKVIVEEMLKGGQSIDEIANRVVERKPGTKTGAIRNQIKGVMKLVKDGQKKKWQKYELLEDKVGLKTIE